MSLVLPVGTLERKQYVMGDFVRSHQRTAAVPVRTIAMLGGSVTLYWQSWPDVNQVLLKVCSVGYMALAL